MIDANVAHEDWSNMQLAGGVTVTPADASVSCPAWSQDRDEAAVFVAVASSVMHWLICPIVAVQLVVPSAASEQSTPALTPASACKH